MTLILFPFESSEVTFTPLVSTKKSETPSVLSTARASTEPASPFTTTSITSPVFSTVISVTFVPRTSTLVTSTPPLRISTFLSSTSVPSPTSTTSTSPGITSPSQRPLPSLGNTSVLGLTRSLVSSAKGATNSPFPRAPSRRSGTLTVPCSVCIFFRSRMSTRTASLRARRIRDALLGEMSPAYPLVLTLYAVTSGSGTMSFRSSTSGLPKASLTACKYGASASPAFSAAADTIAETCLTVSSLKSTNSVPVPKDSASDSLKAVRALWSRSMPSWIASSA
mmetsp:Transcript_4450/g.8178  ORF Transcript_4450/g.8178 Transcript_4450/m.8178 type:complete len:280 (+) Transcript_4450:2592-3431(+)